MFIYIFCSGGGGGEKTQALEHKLYKLQEELTELHRKRGEVSVCLCVCVCVCLCVCAL